MRMILAMVTIATSFVATSLADDEPAGVREIDIKGLRRGFPKGKIDQPLEIKSVAELAKAFSEEEWQAKIKKSVDFEKEHLLFFAWSGSGQDKVTPSVAKEDKKATALFQYQRGLTRDLRSHFRLFALPRDMAWKVVVKGR